MWTFHKATQLNKSKQRYVKCHYQRIGKTAALLPADILFCLCPMSPEEPRKLMMFNMVCRWPWGLFGRPVGRHNIMLCISSYCHVFVHSTMGRQKEINQRHNFLPTAIYFLSLSKIRLPFSIISACFVGWWKGRVSE